jgi:hypothetical protein
MVYSPFLLDKHSVEFTFLHACTAFDTGFLVNYVNTFALSGNSINGAVAGTGSTSNTIFGLNNVLKQGFALATGAFVIHNMGQVFVHEIIHG